MADAKQLELLKAGVEGWNKWREDNQEVVIDLSRADLSGADLGGADLWEAILTGADLSGANLWEADLWEADLTRANLGSANLGSANLKEAKLGIANLKGADLREANFRGAKLPKADLREANFRGADFGGADFYDANLQESDLRGANLSLGMFFGANLSGANLSGVDLNGANLQESDLAGANLSDANLINTSLVRTKVGNANITNCKVYGVSVWDINGEFKEQRELIITPDNASIITVDNIKVAQFIYLILNNKEIRDVLNTLTSKTVLILGRFALPERKLILDALRNKLREYDLLPIVFDFERPDDKDFTETIKTLAGMCYFVIADVTNPKSSPLELQATIPDYQIPFVPIIQEGENPFAMMVDLQKKYDWVLDTISYKDGDQLIKILKKGIIDRAMKMHDKLRLIKASVPTVISGSQFEENE